MGHTSSWKKVIGFVLAFCLLFCVANLPFYSLRDEGYQFISSKRKTQQIDSLKDHILDVAFLGDSECWAAFSPLQLLGEEGIPSYNCATAGQWTGDALILLNKVMQTQSPKVIVLETSTLYSSPNRYKYAFTQAFPIFHYHAFYRKDSNTVKDGYTLGANLVKTTEAYTGRADYMLTETAEHPIDKLCLSKLNEIAQRCKEENIQLVLVSSPSALTWTQGKHLAVANWCTENAVAYVDCNEKEIMEQMGFDWSTDTRDGGDHVNLSGSKKVTAAIGRYLKKNYDLSDQRENADYSTWLKRYQNSKLYQKGEQK